VLLINPFDSSNMNNTFDMVENSQLVSKEKVDINNSSSNNNSSNFDNSRI
jgi:hypothetical protein